MKIKYRVEVKGLNLGKFINQLMQMNVRACNIKKNDDKQMSFIVDKMNADKIMERFSQSSYDLQIYKVKSMKNKTIDFSSRIGVVFGIIVAIIASVIYSQFVWDIKIVGLDRVDKDEINAILNKKNISLGMGKSRVNKDEIECEILESMNNVGNVDVNFIGTSLIIKINENIDNKKGQAFENVISKYNGVIKEIKVLSGTSKVMVGDKVAVGQVLVENAIYDYNNNRTECEAKAEIVIEAVINATTIWTPQKYELVRTGKIKKETKLNFLGINIGKLTKNKGNLIEEEIKENYLVKSCLPIKKITKYTYFCEKKLKDCVFEDDLPQIEKELQQQCLQKISSSDTIIKDYKMISDLQDAKQIDYFYIIETKM